MSKGASLLPVLALCGVATIMIGSASRITAHAAQNKQGAQQSQTTNEGASPEKSQQKNQAPPAAQPQPQTPPVTQSVTGKTGVQSKAVNTSTTATTGAETPGVQTSLGSYEKNAPTRETAGAPTPTPALGAPPNWEQIGQQEQLANSNAAAAARAEVGGPEGTLGVGGALPSYAQGGKPTGSSQTKTPAKQQPK